MQTIPPASTPMTGGCLKSWMVDKNSPTYAMIKSFIEDECPELYTEILDLISESEVQQNYIFKNFVDFFGRKGVSDLLVRLQKVDFAVDASGAGIRRGYDHEVFQIGL